MQVGDMKLPANPKVIEGLVAGEVNYTALVAAPVPVASEQSAMGRDGRFGRRFGNRRSGEGAACAPALDTSAATTTCG